MKKKSDSLMQLFVCVLRFFVTFRKMNKNLSDIARSRS